MTKIEDCRSGYGRVRLHGSPVQSAMNSSKRLQSRPIRWAVLWVWLLFPGLYAYAATAQQKAASPATPEQPPSGSDEVTAAQLDAARKNLAADTTLTDAQKQKAQGLYNQADDWLREYQAAKKELIRLQERITQAPERIQALRHKLAGLPAGGANAPTNASLDQIQLLISQEQATLDQNQENLKQQQDILSRLQVGAKSIGEQIAEHRNRLVQIDDELQTPGSDEPPSLTQARTLALRVRRQLHRVKLETLQQELGNLDLLTNLARAEMDLLNARISHRQQHLASLQQAAQKQEEAQARAAVQKAEVLQAESAALPAPLQAIAAANADFRKELESLVASEKNLTTRLHQVQQKVKAIQADFDHTKRRAETVGPTRAIGRMLKRRRAELPSLRSFQRASRHRTEQMDRATDRQIEIDDLLRSLADIPKTVQNVMAALPSDLQEEQRTQLRRRALELARSRRDALNELVTEYSQYVGQLSQLEAAEGQLVEQADAFAVYIDKQLIWIPGTGLETMLHSKAWFDILGWISNSEDWRNLVWDLASLTERHPVPPALLLGVLGFLLLSRRHAQRQLREIAQATRRIRTDNFLLTLRALWISFAVAAPIPLLLIGVAWELMNQPAVHAFSLAMAGGTLNLGIMLGVLGLLSAVCRDDGLGERHLHWPLPIRKSLARELHWVFPTALPLGFAIGASYAGNVPEAALALGQIAFALLMLVAAIVTVRLLRSDGPILRYLKAQNPGRWLVQLHFLWYPLLVVLPLALAMAATLDYYYTAIQFGQRLRRTVWLFFAMLVLRDLLLRWFYIAERRLRLADALKRRDEVRAQREARQEIDGITEEPSQPMIEEPVLDYSQLSEQSRRLVQVAFLFGGLFGTWSIWIDLLPSLGFLDQVTLPFIVSRVVDGIPKEVPVTLGDLTSALLLLLVTILAAKNLPGLLEIVLLRRLPLTSGSRYAITSLSQYAIVGIGLFAAFGSIGIQWSSIQWLVAALGVGVGFGLQEIVANFISGIILLFEQPIRVGDVVTVDGTTGTVSRLRIRATTITNWDRQELLVPNKEFITGRVLNWTLSNKINRTIITVGVAYGADVAHAMRLMTEAAREHPDILDDPAPFASFEEFGDSALTLRLRAYMGSMDNRLAITSDLNRAINDKLNSAGIVIAFPQLDVHLDTGNSYEYK